MLMVTQGGSLIIKILRRVAILDALQMREQGASEGQSLKLNLPKKTKIIVGQTVREREQFAGKSNVVTSCGCVHVCMAV